jgi:hypothetical protein
MVKNVRHVLPVSLGFDLKSKPTNKFLTFTAADLIELARENPPRPIIEGLLNEKEILVLHGAEECFKSVFMIQMAESIATGAPLLGFWRVPNRSKVGIIETEMHEAQLGERMAKMFGEHPPDRMVFFGTEDLRQWRRRALEGKIKSIERWIREEEVHVLMIDTANDFFRGEDNPCDERAVGGFFDLLRNLAPQGCVLVRHDRKRRAEDRFTGNPNEDMRGSAEWKEDPEALLQLTRKDRRTHEVILDVGKLRYGRKPEPLTLWFDAGTFRLTTLPPAIAVLEAGPHSRQQLIHECGVRFGLAERKADDKIGELRAFLRETQVGHNIVFEIDPEGVRDAPWFCFLGR